MAPFHWWSVALQSRSAHVSKMVATPFTSCELLDTSNAGFTEFRAEARNTARRRRNVNCTVADHACRLSPLEFDENILRLKCHHADGIPGVRANACFDASLRSVNRNRRGRFVDADRA